MTEAQLSGERKPTQQRPCLACTRSKVKCDKCLPCGRCVRLGLRCVETAPSRRGMRRAQAAPQNAELRLLPGLEDMEGDMGSRPANDDSAPATVALDHVRMWVLIALWRKSTLLFSRAASMAARARMSLGDLLRPLFEAPDTEGPYGDALPAGNPLELLVLDPGAAAVPEAEATGRKRKASDEDAPAPVVTRDGPPLRAAAKIVANCPESLPEKMRAEFVAAPAAAADGPLAAAGPYAWGRVCVDGAVLHFATPAFSARFMSAKDMDAVYAANEREVHTAFFAETQSFSLAVAKLFRELATAPRGPGGSAFVGTGAQDGWAVTLKAADGNAAMMHMRPALACYHGGRVSFVTFSFEPLSATAAPPNGARLGPDGLPIKGPARRGRPPGSSKKKNAEAAAARAAPPPPRVDQSIEPTDDEIEAELNSMLGRPPGFAQLAAAAASHV